MDLFDDYVKENGCVSQTFLLPYFRGLQEATLDPKKYGALIVLDTYYCFNSAWTLEIIRNRMLSDPSYSSVMDDVNTLLTKYRSFVATFVTDWHLCDDASKPDMFSEEFYARILDSVVVPTDNVKDYAAYERTNAEKEEEPIYGLITLFPCYAFWPKVFNCFGTDVPDTNVYKDWIIGNQGGRSARIVNSVVDNWLASNKKDLNKTKTLEIFKNCLICEYKMFKEG